MNALPKEMEIGTESMPEGVAEHLLSRNAIATLVCGEENESILPWYGQVIRGRCNLPHIVIREDGDRTVDAQFAERSETDSSDYGPISDAAERRTRPPMGFLIAGWRRDEDRMEALFKHIRSLNVPAILVRQKPADVIQRVVVATARGYHALQQLWVAKEIASMMEVPLHVLYLPHPEARAESETFPASSDLNELIDARSSYLLGVKAEFDICLESDVADGIVRRTHPGDLLVMTAPGSLRDSRHFSSSIPASVARRISLPLILFSPKRPQPVTLRRLFWGRLIRMDLDPIDKQEAIAGLVEAVVQEKQVPPSARQRLIDIAMEREHAMPSAVDCMTAFPHIHLPGFRGVAGSMAICPNGVYFGSPDGSLSRFLFLLITPDGFCDEHLAIQSKIARRIVRPEVREALLRARSPAEVMNVLEPLGEMASGTGISHERPPPGQIERDRGVR